MKLREYRNSKFDKQINEIEFTGKILSNKDNIEFGESIYAIHPFNGDSLVPLEVENSTTHIIETDDGYQDTRKNIFNVNLYGDLINKVVDNENFYVGRRVRVKGFLISKNFSKTEEKIDIMNLCNRYKNIRDGERPFLCEGSKPFVDKDTGIPYTKMMIDWNLLLEEGLIEQIPDEDLQDVGKVEYFFIEDGRVFKQEHKTNYIVIAKDIEPIDGFVDIHRGDENYIEVSGTGKDIFVNEYEGYHSAHICLISKSKDMTRNSYIHVMLKGKNLSVLNTISFTDIIHVKGKLRHKVISKTFVKKKGKKEIEITQYTNLYEIDCREIYIHKK
ncbi:hypothetical protein ACSW8S_19195 (plasmid) [Clostridium perfringens]